MMLDSASHLHCDPTINVPFAASLNKVMQRKDALALHLLG